MEVAPISGFVCKDVCGAHNENRGKALSSVYVDNYQATFLIPTDFIS